MSPSAGDGSVMMDFLLPTGLLVAMPCDVTCTLQEVRRRLWPKALELPGSQFLDRSDSYVFIGITREAEEEQFDDTERLQELPLVMPLLEVSIPKVTRDANRLNNRISDAMGIPVSYLRSIPDPEFQACRAELNHHCRQVATRRAGLDDHQRALVYHPPILDLNVDLPMYVTNYIEKDENMITLNIWEDPSKPPHTLKVSVLSTPSQIVMAYIHCKYSARGHSEEELAVFIHNGRTLYRLKVAGRHEYLLHECLIHEYRYIRDCLSCHTVPDLHIVHKDEIYRDIPCEKASDYSQQEEDDLRHSLSQLDVDARPIWDVDSGGKYRIRVINVTRKRPLHAEVNVVAQLYHGTQKLCRVKCTRDLGWNQTWEFPVSLQNLPRSTRLCLSVITSERGKQDQAVYWVNMQVFDWRGRFQAGEIELGVWRTSRAQVKPQHVYPEGISGGNLDPEAPLLHIRVLSPCPEGLVYPAEGEIEQRLACRTTRTLQRKASFEQGLSDFVRVDTIQRKDFALDLTLIEKNFLWKTRYTCMEFDANLLPRIIQSINWEDRHHVVELYRMLKVWPLEKLSLTYALQLLDLEFPDPLVREVAVRCLEMTLTDEQLTLYLMPLVQTLKFDCYKDNRLARFLLQRALFNRRLGQKFFWLLRSELWNPPCRLRLVPILEAYCRFCGPVLTSLIQEVTALECAISVSEEAKRQDLSLKTAGEVVKEKLQQPDVYETTSRLSSVIDLRYESDNFNVERCRLMSSKMRPMWLEWKNPDELASVSRQEDIKLIFKNGDDLRQDMLIIICLKLMDTIWKYSDTDYKLTIYECLAMGREVGLIEVVQNACTLGSIQTRSGLVSVSAALHDMLYKKNVGSYMETVKDFTLSCAAYCVATYVLGISDRHPDNIMVTENGQVFHIDFGHILNNRKEKFGIKRERVPFVLTDDFIRIITKCKEDFVNTPEWEKFMLQCLLAYMTLRRYANLFITLFKLMLHSELQELSCMADLMELRTTLAVDKSDAEAGKEFIMKLEKSYGGQWSTKMDWFFHRMVHKSKS